MSVVLEMEETALISDQQCKRYMTTIQRLRSDRVGAAVRTHSDVGSFKLLLTLRIEVVVAEHKIPILSHGNFQIQLRSCFMFSFQESCHRYHLRLLFTYQRVKRVRPSPHRLFLPTALYAMGLPAGSPCRLVRVRHGGVVE
jgi:hypothetical protein